MVHALEQIPGLLRADGILIDIHPVPESPRVKVLQGNRILSDEPRRLTDNEDIQSAEQALAEVTKREIFVVEQSAQFDFISYGSSGSELREFWDRYTEYDDSPQDQAKIAQLEAVYSRADEIVREHGEDTKVATHEIVRIARLKPSEASGDQP